MVILKSTLHNINIDIPVYCQVFAEHMIFLIPCLFMTLYLKCALCSYHMFGYYFFIPSHNLSSNWGAKMSEIKCNSDISLNMQSSSLFLLCPIYSLFFSVFLLPLALIIILVFHCFHYWLVSYSLLLFLVIALGNIIYIFNVSQSTT